MASDFERFPSQILTHTLFVLILILEKEPVFPFKCRVLNKGTTLLNLGPPALEARTLPLGYRGGGGKKDYKIR